MEIILIIIALFVFGWIYNFVEDRKESKKQQILADIAKEVLGDFDPSLEKEELLKTARSFAPASSKCLHCSGVMVSRKGVNGVFKGCSRYPMCRYTQN